MSDFYSAFFDEVVATIRGVWTDIGDDQFYTSLQALRQNLIETASLAQGGNSNFPSPPYAVLQIGSLADDTEFAVSDVLKRASITIWRIHATAVGVDNQKDVHAKCKAVADPFDAPPGDPAFHQFSTFQTIERAHIDSSDTNPANGELIAQSRTDLIAASSSWIPGFLVGEMWD